MSFLYHNCSLYLFIYYFSSTSISLTALNVPLYKPDSLFVSAHFLSTSTLPITTHNYITQNPRLTTETSSGTCGSIMAASVREMVGVCEDSSSSDDEALRRCQEAVWDTRRDTNTGETFSSSINKDRRRRRRNSAE